MSPVDQSDNASVVESVEKTFSTADPMPADARTSLQTIAILVPAYKPTPALIDLVRELSASPFAGIIVVDDGSGPAYEAIFSEVQRIERVSLIRHAYNLGKGMALRTGLNAAAVAWPDLAGVVTADADGQHLPQDVKCVAAALQGERGALVMGCRTFAQDVPLRSRFGNLATITACRMVLGIKLSDTQTGLRGIPAALISGLLRLRSTGYEFELDMLLLNKHRGFRIREVPISTVYLDDNQSSHFNPLIDSLKIYFSLLRFSLTSAATALLDYAIFAFSLKLGASLGLAQLLARTVALFFNYTAVRRVVFFSRRKHSVVFPRYVCLVIVSGLVSLGIMSLLVAETHLSVLVAKLIAELAVFLANFTIQRDFIFGTPAADSNGAPSAD